MLSIRKIGIIGRTYRHLNRYRQILTILFRYGFDDLVYRLKIDQYIEIGLQLISRNKRERLEKFSGAERIRMACEELGPTYIKLGQVLSTRPDLIPTDLAVELAKLQDSVPHCKFEEIQNIIESDLGADITELFDDICEIPLASASIGQVHRATLKNGESLAIKVQRPGIRSVIEVDLEIMLHLATLMERHVEGMDLHRPVKIVRELARTLEKEIDYTLEAASTEQVSRQFMDDPEVYIPKVFQDLSTSRVLATEYIKGIKVSDIKGLKAAGMDLDTIIARGADLILKQFFVHGFFHADPHPGNIFILPQNVICLIDFGMMGVVDRKTRDDFVDLLDSVIKRDSYRTAQVFLRLTAWEEEPDPRTLTRDVEEFMQRHLYKPLKDIEIGKLLHHLLELAIRHRLRIFPDIFLILKAFSTVEGVGRVLNPKFDFLSRAEPFVRRTLMARFAPDKLVGEMTRGAWDFLQFFQQFPKDLLNITRLVRQRRLILKFEQVGLADVLATQDRSSNRIAFAIIIAALVIGSALIVISKIPPFFYGISIIGLLGFLSAAILGIWLLTAILRKGRL